MKPINLAKLQSEARSYRRTSPVAIVHSGGRRTIFGCICGARHTAATNYRDARHVLDWKYEHKQSCRKLWEEIQARKSNAWFDAQRDVIYSLD